MSTKSKQILVRKSSRRDFMRLTGLAAGATALAACATPTPQVIKETVVVKETVPVEKVVKQTVEVVKTVEVEKKAAIPWPLDPNLPPPSKHLTIRFFMYEPMWVRTFDRCKQEFLKQIHPDWDMEIIIEAPPGHSDKVYNAAVAGQKLPADVWSYDARVGFATWIKAGLPKKYLVNLKDEIDKKIPGGPTPESTIRSVFSEAEWGRSTDWTDPEQPVYLIANNAAYAVFYWRVQDWLDAGANPDEFQTYEDFIVGAKKLKEKKNMYGVSFMPNPLFPHHEIFMKQYGGAFFDKAGNVTVDGPESVAAMELILRMYDEGIAMTIPSFWSTEGYKLLENDIAGIIIPDWYAGSGLPRIPNAAGKWKMSALPRAKQGGPRTCKAAGSGYSVAKSDYWQYAWEACKWFAITTPGLVCIYDNLKFIQGPGHYLSDSRIADVGDPFFYNSQKWVKEVILPIYKEAAVEYVNPYLPEMFAALNEVIVDVVPPKRTKKPADALKEAADKVRKAMKA